ncbi:hypothetical protein PR048_026763 [Dryococelus australis]|uniref:Uncharacterized protein n=1 Tax=Dryococelus australis TaxID=614101 RepID=A0ABQ9GM98_9NEOP|nr:hypothetical protein PR048_026763 [Dryococelus australis]
MVSSALTFMITITAVGRDNSGEITGETLKPIQQLMILTIAERMSHWVSPGSLNSVEPAVQRIHFSKKGRHTPYNSHSRLARSVSEVKLDDLDHFVAP